MADYVRRFVQQLKKELEGLSFGDQVSRINEVRQQIHELSPFRDEPVDCVLWRPMDNVIANDYNPNTVAPPEMALLEVSIMADGYTQPIVADYDGQGEKYMEIL